MLTSGESIADGAFAQYDLLTSVTIPDTITALGADVFEDCASLETIEFGGTMMQWHELVKDDDDNKQWEVACSDGVYKTYHVTYVLDGGINASSNPASYTVGDLGGADGSIALADPSKADIENYTFNIEGNFNVTQNAYKFLGWYKDSAFGQQVTSITFDLGDVTLYAKWSEETEQEEAIKPYVRVNSENEPSSSGGYILFGSYPQTVREYGVIINSQETDENGYYQGSDGERYAKLYATPYSQDYNNYVGRFANGETITYGKTYYFKVEPIRWRIITTDDSTAFLICDSAIANIPYDNDSNNYSDSSIRQWLNGEFINAAFDVEAQKLIKTTEVDNSITSSTGNGSSYTLENTYDKIFVPSSRDVTNYLWGFDSNLGAKDPARQIEASDYARAEGCFVSRDLCFWWLRHPVDSSYVNIIAIEGSLAGSTYHVSSEVVCVVPAMNITL